MSDARDKSTADAVEQLIKAASTEGISGFIEAFMTVAQYEPDGSTLGRDVNRATAIGIVEALRSIPLRLPSAAVSGLPAASAHTGAIMYVTNGAAGSPCVAFSNGSSWLRTDNNSAVSPT